MLKGNFIYPEITEEHYHFGSGKFSGEVLNESGDWRPFIPPYEQQNRNGVESSACFIEAQQHAIATILEKVFSILDQNYSARFNVIYSGGNENGGDPLKGAQSFRDKGLIPDSMLPFSNDINSWRDFASFKGADKDLCDTAGRLWKYKWDVRYDIVFKREEPVDLKYQKLREALKYSPVPMSVYGWYEKDGVYVKPNGNRDNHLVLCIYVDEKNRPYFLDTYEPFIKIGEPFYNSDFAMRLGITQRTERQGRDIMSFIKELWQSVKNLINSL